METIENRILQPGELFDRYGHEGGRWVSPPGTPIEARALRPLTEREPFTTYRVLMPLEVKAGGVAPWFLQPGLGTQFELAVSVQDLIDRGFIERVTP